MSHPLDGIPGFDRAADEAAHREWLRFHSAAQAGVWWLGMLGFALAAPAAIAWARLTVWPYTTGGLHAGSCTDADNIMDALASHR